MWPLCIVLIKYAVHDVHCIRVSLELPVSGRWGWWYSRHVAGVFQRGVMSGRHLVDSCSCGIYGSCKLMIMKLDVVTLTGPLATRYSMGTLALTRAWPFNATASVSLNVMQLVLSYPGNTLLTT